MAATDFHLARSTEVGEHPDRVWDALVRSTSAWWGAPYLLLTGASAIELPLAAGETVVERLGDASALWGAVTVCEPRRVLAWHGQLGMGPGWEGEVRFDLEPAPGGTPVSVRHDSLRLWGGADIAVMRRSYDFGWADLLERLRLFVETGAKHGAAGLDAARQVAFEPSAEPG